MRCISAPHGTSSEENKQQQQQKHNLLYFRQRVAVGLNQIMLWRMKKKERMLHNSFQQLCCSNTTRQNNKEALKGPIKGCTVGLQWWWDPGFNSTLFQRPARFGLWQLGGRGSLNKKKKKFTFKSKSAQKSQHKHLLTTSRGDMKAWSSRRDVFADQS